MDEAMKDSILEQLLGEVDDHAASKLPGGEAKHGVEISIMVTPHHGEEKEDEELALPDDLGMNDGGKVC